NHVRHEIHQLVIAARDERADALGEIIAQNEAFADYFCALLTMTPTGYPNTCKLLDFASIVGMFTVLHFKAGVAGSQGYAARPRPSQICPALLPPVPVPGHPSYPSGHSTEAHLIALVLDDVLSSAPQKAAMKTDLDALAWRIARNREIAGLHYPSDSAAGKKLAADILPYLQSTSEYQTVLPLAQQEWS
ncbi:MAG: PA-phosphatase, partial [Alphaproteobacteria bacterium]|nr:PA-phosphatase [Alphaproteobacteria bacterium]